MDFRFLRMGKNPFYVPVAFRVMQQFLDVGFILREDIIKRQWNIKKAVKNGLDWLK